jgi:hypothetical protein
MPETTQDDNPRSRRTRGIRCGPGAGKFLYRIRHVHISDHYAPLIAAKAVGAVKLDLVLRAIALPPEYAGARPPGYVLWDWQYEHLHDLAKLRPSVRSDRRRSDRETRHLKRKWVGNQLAKLVDLNLVKIRDRAGSRPEIIVLSDRSKRPLDDPGGSDQRIFTSRSEGA